MANRSLSYCERCFTPFVSRNPKYKRRYCSKSCASKCNSFDHKRVHGEAEPPTPEYRAYNGAKNRCRDPHDANYGGRGIEFRFRSYPEFLTELGRKPSPNHSIERINVNGHYESGNVKWATAQEQALNRTNTERIEFNGKSLTVTQWAKTLGLGKAAIQKDIASDIATGVWRRSGNGELSTRTRSPRLNAPGGTGTRTGSTPSVVRSGR
jgi:hypothetical protein